MGAGGLASRLPTCWDVSQPQSRGPALQGAASVRLPHAPTTRPESGLGHAVPQQPHHPPASDGVHPPLLSSLHPPHSDALVQGCPNAALPVSALPSRAMATAAGVLQPLLPHHAGPNHTQQLLLGGDRSRSQGSHLQCGSGGGGGAVAGSAPLVRVSGKWGVAGSLLVVEGFHCVLSTAPQLHFVTMKQSCRREG